MATVVNERSVVCRCGKRFVVRKMVVDEDGDGQWYYLMYDYRRISVLGDLLPGSQRPTCWRPWVSWVDTLRVVYYPSLDAAQNVADSFGRRRGGGMFG